MTEPGSDLDPQHCGRRVLSLVRGANTLTIVAPFITTSGIVPILDAVAKGCNIEIITRWRPDEVAAGVSDPDIFGLVNERGGTIDLHPVVHAKAYIAGTKALVGSANVTANGLGWFRPGAAEILVDTPAGEPALTALLAMLRLTAARATKADRDAVLAAAAALPRSHVEPVREIADPANWLPMYRPPQVLWRVYTGQREQSVVELVRPELDALGVPAGLESEESFNAYVGAILRQGFTGRVAQECSNLTTVKAVQRLVSLSAAAGFAVEDPADLWETLAAWIAHFMPTYQRTWGGTRLIG